ncbi:MAG: type I DNA topoisomerase [Acidimicrobiia bacterium]
MSKLVIVESPAKAKTISGYLGPEYIVDSSYGHILDLPKSGLAVDTDNGFVPAYEVPDKAKAHVARLKKALKGVDELLLATDEDREGEAISAHLVRVLNPKVPVKRMVFHEITKAAILDAIDHSRTIDEKMVAAQEGRRVLDRLVGYEVSPVVWRKVGNARSAGRVQSVAARLIVERERARMAFRRAGYSDILATFRAAAGSFTARLATVDGTKVADAREFDPATGALATTSNARLLSTEEATALAAQLVDRTFHITNVESKQFAERPAAPFTTSTLQQEAGRKLRFGSAKTMAVAQRLYERGFITYMRTDSTNLSAQALTAARASIAERFGSEYLPDAPRAYSKKAKGAQEAHEAIRPAGERIRSPEEVSAQLDADERKLYELVWIRTIASQMVDARARRVSVTIAGSTVAGTEVTFRASGKTYEFLGFRRAYVEDRDEVESEDERESRLPALAEGEHVAGESFAVEDHETRPPARFTEASLVKELEERGIGRPSTYSSIIQTLLSREYVTKRGQALVPSWTAFALVRLLEDYFGHLVDYGFTARMEEELDVIAAGDADVTQWLHEFYFGGGQPGLKALVATERLGDIDARAINSIAIGPDEDGVLIELRVGRYGPYFQRGDDRAPVPNDLAPDEVNTEVALEALARGVDGGRNLGTDPKTGLEVVAKDGRFGPYVQLGEMDGKNKPKTASLFSTMKLEDITFEEALELLSIPRLVGLDAEGVAIETYNGRYGPYLKRGTDTRSLDTEGEIFSLTMEQALTKLAEPKKGRGRQSKPPLAELGPHPASGAPIRILEGRFGPYVTDGTTNASVPRGEDPAEVTIDVALSLIAARIAKGPTKKVSKKKAVKKTAKKAVKKKVVKKTAKKAVKKKVVKKTGVPKALAPASEPTAS